MQWKSAIFTICFQPSLLILYPYPPLPGLSDEHFFNIAFPHYYLVTYVFCSIHFIIIWGITTLILTHY